MSKVQQVLIIAGDDGTVFVTKLIEKGLVYDEADAGWEDWTGFDNMDDALSEVRRVLEDDVQSRTD